MVKKELIEWSKDNKSDTYRSITYWYDIETSRLVVFDYKWEPKESSKKTMKRYNDFFTTNNLKVKYVIEDFDGKTLTKIKRNPISVFLVSRNELDIYNYSSIKIVG